ncbi:hypothetical protein BOX37_23575 [Nocardia mangyaensis]|uniref:Uncharacterized protein n=1 Tax=Nocardia mangyaensis TaxID=2213200 RepID=A0A1J0VWH9_9NOCA|nr:hypothetical protein [Nocardia mangyaensis]APE36416.1 hypothetical protein BOX37_23575 [Nocardia mangyaensis]
MIGSEVARIDKHDGGEHDRPAGWVQRDDGSLWVLDEYGVLWPVAAFTLAELYADVQGALGALGDPVDVTPLSVADTEADR